MYCLKILVNACLKISLKIVLPKLRDIENLNHDEW